MHSDGDVWVRHAWKTWKVNGEAHIGDGEMGKNYNEAWENKPCQLMTLSINYYIGFVTIRLLTMIRTNLHFLKIFKIATIN